MREREDANRTRVAGHLDEIQGVVAITLKWLRDGAVGFIDWLDVANASSAPNLIVRIRLMQPNTVRTELLIPAGRINERCLRLTCVASSGAFGNVQVKELPSSVDHSADGLP